MAINVSESGLSFTAGRKVEPGAPLALEIKAPDFEAPVLAMAKTVRCRELRDEGIYDMDVEFWWVGWKERRRRSEVHRKLYPAADRLTADIFLFSKLLPN